MTPAGNNPPGNQGLKHEALFKKLVRFLSSSLHLFLLSERMSGAFPRRNTKIKGFSRAGWADTHTMLSMGAGTGLTQDFRVGFDVTCPERPLLTSPSSHRPSPTTLPGLPAAAGPICRYRRRSAVTRICWHTDRAQKMTTCARGPGAPARGDLASLIRPCFCVWLARRWEHLHPRPAASSVRPGCVQ